MKNYKTSFSGYIGGFLYFLALVATVPTELQALIMAMFPKDLQPYTALFFGFAGFIVRSYQGHHTADAETVDKVKDQLRPKPVFREPLIIILIPLLLLSGVGCSTTADQKAQWSSTGEWLVKKTAAIALNTVVSAAQSRGDATTKADWLDSLALGFRSQGSSIVSSNDVRELAAIWAPAKPHWSNLAEQLAALHQASSALPPDQRAEFTARGLETVANHARIK